MHAVLEQAAVDLGFDATVLRESAEYTREILKEVTRHLDSGGPPEDGTFDVLVLGSLAREEASGSSDFDYLIVAHQLSEDVRESRRLLAAVDDARKKANLRKPGSTGIFGRMISAADVTERIGLEDDTNVTHTHRMLILQESKSIYQPELHRRLLGKIIDRYLADYPQPKAGVPRFLLNDILRYWRTLAVDYQAKRWGQLTPEWGLRYLKLIISRKLAFVGTLTSLFLTEEATLDYFLEQFEMPPLARFAQLHRRLKGSSRDSLRHSLEIAEDFARELGEPDFRAEASKVQDRNEIRKVPRFNAMYEKGRELQIELEKIFFDDELLREPSRRYLSF